MSEYEDSSGIARGVGQQVSLLRVWPEIADALKPNERSVAGHALLAPLLQAQDADPSAAFTTPPEAVYDFAIVEGVVLKNRS